MQQKIFISISIPHLPFFEYSSDEKTRKRIAAMAHAFDVSVETQDYLGWFFNDYHLVVSGDERNVSGFQQEVIMWQSVG